MGTACEFVLLSLKQLETVLSKIYTEMIQSMLASIIRLVMLTFGLMEVQCKFFAGFGPNQRSSDRSPTPIDRRLESASPWMPELRVLTDHITSNYVYK